MKKLLKGFTFLVLIALIILSAGVVFVPFNNLDSFKGTIERIVTSSLGRIVQIEGPIAIKLFPNPNVILNEVSIANAEWGSQPTMLQLGHIGVSVDLWSVFSKTIVLKSLSLHDAAILIEHDKAQGHNWEMGKKQSTFSESKTRPEKAKRISVPIIAERIDASNITLTLVTPETPSKVYRISSLSLKTDPSGKITITSSGQFLDQAITFDSELTSQESLLSGDSVTYTLQGSLGNSNIKGQFSVDRLETLSGLKGKLNLNVPDLANTLKVINLNVPLSGPMTADINAAQTDNGTSLIAKAEMEGIKADITTELQGMVCRKAKILLDVDDIKKIQAAANIKLPLTGKFTAQAAIDFLDTGYKADIKASADGLSTDINGSYIDKEVQLTATLSPLKRVSELFDLKHINSETLKLKAAFSTLGQKIYKIKNLTADIDKNQLTAQGNIDLTAESDLLLTVSIPDLKAVWEKLPVIPLNAKTTVRYSANKIALSNLSLVTDKSDLKGDLVWVKGSKGILTANLASDTLDLRSFNTGSKDIDKTSSEHYQKALQARPKTDDRYVFKDNSFQLALLNEVEADFKLSVKNLYHQIGEIQNVVINTVLEKGRADTKLKFDSASHGHAAVKIDVSSQEKQAIIASVGSLSDFRLSLRDVQTIPDAEKPPVNLSFELKSRGSSPRALASMATGRLLFTQGSGKISNSKVGVLTNDILDQLSKALNPFAEKEKYSQLECTVIDLDLQDGQAQIKNMLTQSEKLMIIGGGEIDLKTETIKIEFNTKPRSGIGISADMFVTPFVYVSGTLKRPSLSLNRRSSLLHGSAAVATGGLTLVLRSIFNRATAHGDHCEKMKEHVGEHLPPPF